MDRELSERMAGVWAAVGVQVPVPVEHFRRKYRHAGVWQRWAHRKDCQVMGLSVGCTLNFGLKWRKEYMFACTHIYV